MLHAARLIAPEADDIPAKARCGDAAAVARLIQAHQGMVFSLALHVIGNRSTAEDMAQDVFPDMFRHLEGIESAAHLVFWLRRVTSHRCIDRMRRDPHRAEVPGNGIPERASHPSSREVKDNPDAIQQMIAGLQRIYVKGFEFDRDGVYSSADVEAVRRQSAAPGWSRMVVVDKEERETVDIYSWRQGDRSGGLGILVAEPRELTIVNIVGEIDLAKLAALQGQFGVPKLPLDQSAQPQGAR